MPGEQAQELHRLGAKPGHRLQRQRRLGGSVGLGQAIWVRLMPFAPRGSGGAGAGCPSPSRVGCDTMRRLIARSASFFPQTGAVWGSLLRKKAGRGGWMRGTRRRGWVFVHLPSCFLFGLLGRMGGPRPRKLGFHWAPFILPFWAAGSDGWAAANELGSH